MVFGSRYVVVVVPDLPNASLLFIAVASLCVVDLPTLLVDDLLQL